MCIRDRAGAAADIIVMDYKPFTPFSDENIDGHMIFGMTGRQDVYKRQPERRFARWRCRRLKQRLSWKIRTVLFLWQFAMDITILF